MTATLPQPPSLLLWTFLTFKNQISKQLQKQKSPEISNLRKTEKNIHFI